MRRARAQIRGRGRDVRFRHSRHCTGILTKAPTHRYRLTLHGAFPLLRKGRKNVAIRRDNCPPPAGNHMHVQRLKAGQHLSVYVLSREIEGVWTHWNGRRSFPCRLNGQPCPPALHCLPQVWKGYLHVLIPDTEQTLVVELTSAAARQVKEQLGPRDTLRGILLELSRGKAANNSRLTARLLLPHPHPESLPGAKDPIPSCEHLWGTKGESDCTNGNA